MTRLREIARPLNSIATRMAIAIAIAALAVIALSIGFLRYQANVRPVYFDAAWIADEAVQLRDRLNMLPVAERADVARAASSATLRVRWSEATSATSDGEWSWTLEPLATALETRLGDGRYRLRSVLPEDKTPVLIGAEPASQHISDAILGMFEIDVPLSAGDQVTLHSSFAHRAFADSRNLLIYFALVSMVVLAIALVVARFLSGPIRRFSHAAFRLGLDPDSAALPQEGPSELRSAIAAFNGMQHRITRFVADRSFVLSAISHDLRTPLTRHRLRVEKVADDDLRRRMIGDIEEMDAMLRETLAFAKDQTEQEPRQRFDLAALLITIVDDVTDAGAEADYAGPEHLPFDGRPVALKRLFENLIDNAIRYGLRAHVALAERRDDMVVCVEDDGPGVPADQRERIFEPFVRLEDSRNAETGGTGLGLTIARSIARRHGGDIAVGMRDEGGLRVVVTLPIAARDERRPSPPASA